MARLQTVVFLGVAAVILYFFGVGSLVSKAGVYDVSKPSLHTGKFSGDKWRTNLTVAAHEIINTKWLRIQAHTVKSPYGDKVMEDWIWIDEQDQVNVLVNLKSNGRYVISRQSKYGLPSMTLATLGGLIEPGETPEEAARRELLEEMGMEAEEMVSLGRFRVHANRGDGHVNCFLAREVASSATALESDDLEEHEWVQMTRQELLRALLKGEFQEVKWTATVAMALLMEQEQEQ